MGSNWFNRDKEEDKIHQRAILDKEKKELINYLFAGLLAITTVIGVVLSCGTILLIDGGITITYIIANASLKIYEKIIEKYMKYIPTSKKRDFNLEIHKFYNNVLCNLITENNSPIKTFINQFIDEENILE